MKRFPVIALLALAGIATAGSLQAQSREVRAKIPFDFVVSGKQLPAGNYSFLSQPDEAMVIRNADQRVTVLSLTHDVSGTTTGTSRLVFNKYGDHYFLNEILCPTIALNVELPQSKQEKQIRSQQAFLGPDQVLLALN